jgi:hypothetical protein
MITNSLLRRLHERVPEFAADELFCDLPHAVIGEFAQFLTARMKRFGAADPVVTKAFELVNEIFREDNPDLVNVIETSLFEPLLDDAEIAAVAVQLLAEPGRLSLKRIASWAAGKTPGLT